MEESVQMQPVRFTTKNFFWERRADPVFDANREGKGRFLGLATEHYSVHCQNLTLRVRRSGVPPFICIITHVSIHIFSHMFLFI